MEETDENAASSPPKQTRRTRLKNVMTPSYKPIPLKETPGGTRVRQIFSGCGRQLFVPNSPTQSKIPNTMQTTIHEKLPKLHYERPAQTSKTCRVTLSQIDARAGAARRTSQRQLTGASALDVFIAEGANHSDDVHGRDRHWAHIIAFCLGGEQRADNLVPTTASANYNTLDAIERLIPIRLRSSQNPVDYVDIKATIRYDDEDKDSLIPVEIIYELSWEEQSVPHTETHYIKTTTTTRYTDAMLKTFAAVRDEKVGALVDDDDDDDVPAQESQGPSLF